MIMPRGSNQLLLPANPFFIGLSLLLALGFNLLPLGRHAALPDLLALVLVFWNVHQPLRIGIGTAFCFGLVMDVQHSALLGQHAWTYTTLAFFATMVHRRIQWFKVHSQAVQLVPLFVGAFALEFLVRLVGGGVLPGWGFILKPLLTSLLWPLASTLLLLPQRRTPNPDMTRPL